MTSVIRKLTNEEIHLFVDISINAYPGFTQNTPEFKERIYNNLVNQQENESSIDIFGLFRNEKLIGGMKIFYFTMNLYSQKVEVGGIGSVAVDLLHKKEKVAKEMVQFFIEYFQKLGTSFVMLYPFRPDFYKKMGFGYGPKMNQYKVEPIHFPNAASKEGLTFLDESHKDLIRDCYDRYAAVTHGMVFKSNQEINTIFNNPNYKLVGYLNNGKLEGYLRFTFKKLNDDNFLMNNMVIQEMIYENPKALAKLHSFIHSQADQIHRVIIQSSDDYLPFIFSDARNGSNQLIPSVYHETNTSGIGLMYRIIDIEKFMQQLNPINNVTCAFKLIVNDSFLSNELQISVISLTEGKFSTSSVKEPEFEVEIDISDLSSLLMGVIDVNCLYQFGLLKINNPEYLETFEKMFKNGKQPICVTAF